MENNGTRNGIIIAQDGTSVTILPGRRYGTVNVPSSKSVAHRLLICAALSENGSVIRVRAKSADIDATAACLEALGAGIRAASVNNDGTTEFTVTPLDRDGLPQTATLRVGESGSTLRFLLPVAAALGVDSCFVMDGRLPERPLGPLLNVLTQYGITVRQEGNVLCTSGKLRPGAYELPGNVSSQYISGMLFAMPLLDGEPRLRVTGPAESAGYITLTLKALEQAGLTYSFVDGTYALHGGRSYRFEGTHTVESDWSGAAFPLCAGVFSYEGISVPGLDTGSAQGDKQILEILFAFGARVTAEQGTVTVRRGVLKGITLDASDIPDLIPAVAVVAAYAEGETRIRGAARLRLKESDRLKSTCALLKAIGSEAAETEDGLLINGGARPTGGQVESYSDHRIAMAGTVAAFGASGPVTVNDPGCVAKSFPDFFEQFGRLELSTDGNGLKTGIDPQRPAARR